METEGPDPPGKSEVTIGFLRHTGIDSLEKQLGSIASPGRL